MKNERINQIIVVSSEDPQEFEQLFNQRISELDSEADDVKFDISNGRFSAIISYHYTKYIKDCIADDFHEEGIYYHCRNCPHLEDPKDKRIKWCKCAYASLGTTHKNHEACEYFYKQLMTGAIVPREDWEI